MESWPYVIHDIISWLYRKYGNGEGHCFIFCYFFFFAVFSTSNKNLKTQMRSVRTSSPSKTKTEIRSWFCVWVLLLSCSDSQMIPLFSGRLTEIIRASWRCPNGSNLSFQPRVNIVYIFITAWNPNVSSLKGDQCRIGFLDRGFFMKYISNLKKHF